MSRFIGLTDSKDGKTIFFNVDNIVKIQADTKVRGRSCTGIWIRNKSRAEVYVDESVYCVLSLIAESYSNCERSERLIQALERCDTYLRRCLRSETMPTDDEIRDALIKNAKLLAGSREV
jgi:hypothetical protein